MFEASPSKIAKISKQAVCSGLSLELALSPIQNSGSEAKLLPGGARLKGKRHTPLNLVKATVLPALP